MKTAGTFIVSLVATTMLHAPVAIAQTAAQAEAFNQAWKQHKSTSSGDDIHAKLNTAREVLEIGRSFMPDDDERLAMLLHNYGDVLLQAGRNYEAREVLLDALRKLEGIYGKDSLKLIDTIKAAADAWGGHPDYARRQHSGYKRALRITAHHFGKDSVEYADLSMETGARLYDLAQSNLGDKRLRSALQYYEANFPSPDIRSGAAAFYLGKIRLGRGNIDGAIEYLERSMPHFQGDSETQRMNRLRAMALLVQAYENKQQSDKVDQYAAEIGREMSNIGNEDLVPLITANPAYPEQFRERGIEGYVVVEFSIDQQGRVVNPMATESDMRYSTHEQVRGGMPRPGDFKGSRYESLEEAAVEAVSLYRYAPRYIDDQPVFVHGMSVRVEFEIRR